LQVSLLGSDVDGDALTAQLVSEPVSGELFLFDPINGLGNKMVAGDSTPAPATLCYRPFMRFFHGTDSFTFKVSDACCRTSNTATISIEIRNVT
jgi:hypothetical protein